MTISSKLRRLTMTKLPLHTGILPRRLTTSASKVLFLSLDLLRLKDSVNSSSSTQTDLFYSLRVSSDILLSTIFLLTLPANNLNLAKLGGQPIRNLYNLSPLLVERHHPSYIGISLAGRSTKVQEVSIKLQETRRISTI